MNPLQESISKCTVSGNVVSLPKEQLDNYAAVRKAFIDAGAVYKRNTFVFPKEAQPYIDRLLGGEKINRKQSLQEFFTPDDLADYLVDLADVRSRDKVLEPQAGQGALIQAIRRVFGFDFPVDYCELDEINRGLLLKIGGLRNRSDNFLDFLPTASYDKIIANPPFSKNQDIDHINHMYDHLSEGGRIVSVASKHWQFADDKKSKAFKIWLDAIDARVIDLEAGRFKSSGTMVASCIVIIDK